MNKQKLQRYILDRMNKRKEDLKLGVNSFQRGKAHAAFTELLRLQNKIIQGDFENE